MTPSEAHESAWQRGTDHDAMTIACRDVIETFWKTITWTVSDYKSDPKEHSLAGISCESFMVSERGPRWFADILVRWDCSFKKYPNDVHDHTHSVYGVFEIKPKLFTAGAALRQRNVQYERLSAWISDRKDAAGFVEVIAVEGDPNIQSYTSLARRSLLVWDGATKIKRIRLLKEAA